MTIKLLVDVAEAIYAKSGKVVFIKWDGYRDRYKWTICIDNARLCDTDCPYERLSFYYYSLVEDKECTDV